MRVMYWSGQSTEGTVYKLHITEVTTAMFCIHTRTLRSHVNCFLHYSTAVQKCKTHKPTNLTKLQEGKRKRSSTSSTCVLHSRSTYSTCSTTLGGTIRTDRSSSEWLNGYYVYAWSGTRATGPMINRYCCCCC